MLPIGGMSPVRNWSEIATVLVWLTVCGIMLLAKLKAAQDVIIVCIMLLIFGIANADSLFSHLRIYKVFVVLRRVLLKECICATCCTFACLVAHGILPEARAPGIALPFLSLAVWAKCGVQVSPVVSLGLWAGGTNLMTKVQLGLRFTAQFVGTALALLAFALFYSFRLPGKGPFEHFLSLEAACATFMAFAGAALAVRRKNAATGKAPEKVQ